MNTEFRTTPEICQDFFELMEDTVSYFTDEYGLSAELAYVMTEAFAQTKISKLKEIKGSFNA